jgi:hypothetical protein
MPYAPIDSEAGTVSVFGKEKVRKQVGDNRPEKCSKKPLHFDPKCLKSFFLEICCEVRLKFEINLKDYYNI